MLRAEVRALADNLKDTENRAGLQVSLCEQPLLAAPLVPLDIQPRSSHACHLLPKPFTQSMPHVFAVMCLSLSMLQKLCLQHAELVCIFWPNATPYHYKQLHLTSLLQTACL